jgi:hypothetical protein
MIGSPIAALLLTVLFGNRARIIFWVEAFGIRAFSAYWYVKSQEMRLSHVEERALKGRSAKPDKTRIGLLPKATRRWKCDVPRGKSRRSLAASRDGRHRIQWYDPYDPFLSPPRILPLSLVVVLIENRVLVQDIRSLTTP